MSTVDPSYTNFGTLNVPPYRFSANKVRFAFMNDTVPPLYMATRLWASVFPTDFRVAIDDEFETTTQEIVSALRRHYDHGKQTMYVPQCPCYQRAHLQHLWAAMATDGFLSAGNFGIRA